MRFRKTVMRGAFVFVVAALLLTAALALPARAATIYFTAVNNSLNELDDSSMPVNVNGTIYVPFYVFNSADLGIVAAYSKSDQMVTILKGDRELYFDMSSSMALDSNSQELTFKAIYRKYTVYLPVAAVCDYMGFSYTLIEYNESAYVVRIKSSIALDDLTFVRAAQNLLQTYYNQYIKNSATEPPNPSAPVTPPPTPTPTPLPTYGDVQVLFAIAGLDAEQSPALLSLLDSYGYKAAFFARPDEIAAQPALVRELCGRGYSIGLLLGAETLEEDAERGAALLREAAMRKTLLAALDGRADSEAVKKAEELGLVLWFDSGNGIYDAAGLAELTEGLPESGAKRLNLILNGGEELDYELRGLLEKLRIGKYDVQRLTEVISPCLVITE